MVCNVTCGLHQVLSDGPVSEYLHYLAVLGGLDEGGFDAVFHADGKWRQAPCYAEESQVLHSHHWTSLDQTDVQRLFDSTSKVSMCALCLAFEARSLCEGTPMNALLTPRSDNARISARIEAALSLKDTRRPRSGFSYKAAFGVASGAEDVFFHDHVREVWHGDCKIKTLPWTALPHDTQQSRATLAFHASQDPDKCAPKGFFRVYMPSEHSGWFLWDDVVRLEAPDCSRVLLAAVEMATRQCSNDALSHLSLASPSLAALAPSLFWNLASLAAREQLDLESYVVAVLGSKIGIRAARDLVARRRRRSAFDDNLRADPLSRTNRCSHQAERREVIADAQRHYSFEMLDIRTRELNDSFQKRAILQLLHFALCTDFLGENGAPSSGRSSAHQRVRKSRRLIRNDELKALHRDSYIWARQFIGASSSRCAVGSNDRASQLLMCNTALEYRVRAPVTLKTDANTGRGVVACKAIARGDYIMPYIGELITRVDGHARERRYGERESYMYYFRDGNADFCIDATDEGMAIAYGPGRLMNHSITPNMKTRVAYDHCGSLRLCFIASRDIRAGEELFFDYGDDRPQVKASNPWLGAA